MGAWNGPTAAQIAVAASSIRGIEVSLCMVQTQLARLNGHRRGNGKVGPVGFALSALRNPTRGTSAAILLAMDHLGVFATPDFESPWHDSRKAFLKSVANTLRKGDLRAVEQHGDEVAVLFSADPDGLGRVEADWPRAPRHTRRVAAR